MKPLLLLAFLVPVMAHAFTPEEDFRHLSILTEVNQAFTRADGDQPPCEGIDLAAAAALSHEPPRSCVKSARFSDIEALLFGEIRASCHSMERYLDQKLRNADLAQLNVAAKKEIRDGYENIFRELTEKVDLTQTGTEFELLTKEFDSDPVPKGSEYEKSDCYLPAFIQLQARKKLLGLLNKHKGIINYQLEEFMSNADGRPSVDNIFRYLREGESAFAAEGSHQSNDSSRK